jgi:exonuclease SbcD
MRILHFSDVHIGVENYGRPDPDTGLSTRLTDFLDTLDEVVDYALENQVDLALFCGDAYKSRDPSQTHQREFARRIARISSAGIPVFMVVGNHDMPFTASRANALEIFRTLDVNNVTTGDTLDVFRISTPAGPVQVLAVPWIRRSTFLTRDDTRGMTPDQLNDAIQSAMTDLIRGKAESLDPSIPAVLAGHVSVSQARTSSEQTMMLGRDHVLLMSAVALPQLDYVALGHIHSRQELETSPPVIYSGSLQRVDFGEEKDDKGFYVVDIDPGLPQGQRVTEHTFHEVAARSFLTVSVDIPRDDLDPTATVIEAINRHFFQDAIVRVMIRVPADLDGLLRDADIRRALDGAHYIAAISREVAGEARTRLGKSHAQTLDPAEALALYMDSRNLPKDRAKVLMEHATELMGEEDPE